METMQEVKWGDRIVKCGIAETVNNENVFKTDFTCDVVREYEKMGLSYQAELQRQKNRIDYVESFGFRRLSNDVLYRITEYYVKIYTKSFTMNKPFCNWNSDIFQSTWSVKGSSHNQVCEKYALSSPWALMEHAQELIPILVARSLWNKRDLFDMILISSTAHITTIETEKIEYISPVAIGKVGINSYLLAYWGDYPKFLEYTDFRVTIINPDRISDRKENARKEDVFDKVGRIFDKIFA